ncbi:MBL fold metallo-hydrolase [Calidifontibacillus oryziterrae]|uniref:MBL fold metallo-hydrolase n=1 Tax=Calidifontibacillus oryziterrae TaxID=1191699 RepID=UPI0002E93F55|nr:MBL fold metallo-hydrolase [Calidifontibacillus oryziterrae]
MNVRPIDLGNNISFFDIFDMGMEKRTGTYVIHDKSLTIIETSASPSVRYIVDGLKKLNINPKDIQYIIVTHIHLDHAGGAGLLVKECPNAKVVVHPKGARHLIDPTRLIAGARAVYGESFDELFNPILPIPEDRILIKHDRETIQLENRVLTFYDSPGHANHHFSIHDSGSNGIFTGDTCGIYYQDISEFDFYLPTTSPNQFNPEAMLDSIGKFESLNVNHIYFGHFGMSNQPTDVYSKVRKWLPIFVDTAEEVYNKYETKDVKQLTNEISEQLFKKIKTYLTENHIPDNHNVYDIIKLDVDICSMGLVDYLIKREGIK